ncbi:hypothetical protein PTKIN_Ptkin15bG0079800 [Pterospermum kingtungense]
MEEELEDMCNKLSLGDDDEEEEEEEEIDADEGFDGVDFSRCPFWVQLHGMPPLLMSSRMGNLFGGKIGKMMNKVVRKDFDSSLRADGLQTPRDSRLGSSLCSGSQSFSFASFLCNGFPQAVNKGTIMREGSGDTQSSTKNIHHGSTKRGGDRVEEIVHGKVSLPLKKVSRVFQGGPLVPVSLASAESSLLKGNVKGRTLKRKTGCNDELDKESDGFEDDGSSIGCIVSNMNVTVPSDVGSLRSDGENSKESIFWSSKTVKGDVNFVFSGLVDVPIKSLSFSEVGHGFPGRKWV